MKTIKNLKAEEIRKSILQLAIQGKLVKQDPNDEPASELVKRIYAEKQKLIKEGKIKKDKNESYIFKGDDNYYYEKIGKNEPVKLEDLPFDIPDNWTWIRFPNLVNFILGKTPERHNPKYWNDGKYPWFSIADMKDKQIIFETKEKISECSLNENFSSSLTPAGTLIMSFKLTVGRVSILGVNAIHNEAIISIFPYLTENNTIRDWLFYTLGLIVEYVDHTDAIKGSTLNKQKMNAMLIPLPPLREQNRIITKLLETKPLIDKYNDTEVKLSVLEQEFPDRLKKSILQYAIEGKLVKQDPNDEPASVLLDHIKAEKEKLIKEGKIKRNKNESYIYQGDDKNYYENLPKSWTTINMSKICTSIGDGIHGTPIFSDFGDYSFINGSNLFAGHISLFGTKKCKEDEYFKYRKPLNYNTILISINGTLGNIAIYKGEKIILGKSAAYLTLVSNNLINWLLLFLKSSICENYFSLKKTGSTIKNIPLSALRTLLVAVPPYNEQIKIIKKIKYINQLIDL